MHLWAVGSGVELHADTTQAGRTAQPIAFNGDGTLLAIGRPSGLVDVVDLSSEATLIHLDGGDDIRALLQRYGVPLVEPAAAPALETDR